MRKIALILILVVFAVALLLVPARAQEPPAAVSVVQVEVRYDPDHDGVEEGVGEGRAVEVRENNKLIATALTDEHSQAGFVLTTDKTYRLSAWVPPTTFLYNWVCTKVVFVDDPGELEVIHCFERFFLQLPWAASGTAVE